MSTARLVSLDRQVALSRVGGDTELLREIAAIFVGDYPNTLSELRTALEHNDAQKVERAAHGLKGSVANFGAQAAVDAAFHLEKMGYTGDLSQAAATLSALDEALIHLRGELDSLCAELS
jgi:HPt (histidine-containing phosphotransfer) domain-containing protein